MHSSSSTKNFPLDVLVFGVLALKGRGPIGFASRALSLLWLTGYLVTLLWILLLWGTFAFANRWALEIREMENFSLLLFSISTVGTVLNLPLALSVREKVADKRGYGVVGIALLAIALMSGIGTWTMDRNIQEAIWKARSDAKREALYNELDRVPRTGGQN